MPNTSRAAVATIKATNEKFWYDYKDSWNVRSYSFDGGTTWHKSKSAAYVDAKTKNQLQAA